MIFRLRPADKLLIASAVRLGEWILAQPETKPEQREAVLRLNEALRCLPDPSPGADLSFGVDLGFKQSDGKALSQTWRVGLFNPEGERRKLVVYSTWTTYPPGRPEDEMAHELDFELALGDPELGHEQGFVLWSGEVEAMSERRVQSSHFEIEAEWVPGSSESPSALPVDSDE